MSDNETQEQETKVVSVSDHSGENSETQETPHVESTEDSTESSIQENTDSEDTKESDNSKESEDKETDFKSESRKWETRSKENLKALEALQAEHAETQKKLEELNSLREEVTSLKTSAAKSQIGKAYGLPDDLLSFLSGTEEEMKTQAETLSASIGQRTGGVSRMQGNTTVTHVDPWDALTQSLQENIK